MNASYVAAKEVIKTGRNVEEVVKETENADLVETYILIKEMTEYMV